MKAALTIAIVTLTALATAAAPDGQAQAERTPASRWYKGNTHTHTINSDGDSTPDEVVRWYREHGYNFLVLSDHNVLTGVDTLNGVMGADGQFLVIRGEEVTDRFGDKPVHVNGLNVERLVAPQGGSSVVETVQRNVDAVRVACRTSTTPISRGRSRRTSSRKSAGTTCWRSSTVTRSSTMWAAAAAPGSRQPGTPSCPEGNSCSGSPWMTPTSSSARGITRPHDPGRGGSWCGRRV